MKDCPSHEVPCRDRRAGFALLLSLWAIGLLSAFAVVIFATAHYRWRAAANITEGVAAQDLADGGIVMARLELQDELAAAARSGGGAMGLAMLNVPRFCTLGSGAVLAFAVEDEGGKIDLNQADRRLVLALLRGLGASPDLSSTLTRAITAFSSPGGQGDDDGAYAAEGRPFGPKRQPFETTLELDQVAGLPHDLFEAMLPYVTVYSGQAGIDNRSASPALLALLRDGLRAPGAAGESVFRAAAAAPLPWDFSTLSTRRSFMIDAEAMTPGEGYFSREAIIQLSNASATFVGREWRRGRGRFRSQLLQEVRLRKAGSSSTWPDCRQG